MTVLYTEVGEMNNVIEIWRHDDVAAMVRAREGQREAKEWRAAIANIAPLSRQFSNRVFIPTPWSPWR